LVKDFSFHLSTAPPSKTVVKERRPSSGGVRPVQQVFYTEWKNETGWFEAETEVIICVLNKLKVCIDMI